MPVNPVAEFYQMRWEVRLHLPRNFMVGVLGCGGSDDVCMELGGQLKRGGVEPPVPPASISLLTVEKLTHICISGSKKVNMEHMFN